MKKVLDALPEGYGVTEQGDVYSLDRTQVIPNRWGTTTERKLKGKVLKPWLDSKGRYLYVSFGRVGRMSIHRAVALIYLPNPDNKPCVHHKDHNTRNNHASNLEWVSHQENSKYSAEAGNVSGFYGEQKLVPSEGVDSKILEEYFRVGSIKKMDGFMNCDRTTLGRYIQKRGLL